MAGRKIRAVAQMIAAYLLEAHDDDLEWDVDRFRVKGVPEMSKTMTELAFAAYNNIPPGMEPGLEVGQEMDYDEYGNLKNASLLDFFLPTAVETPSWETDYTTTPSPHHPIGAKGVGESPNVGGVSAFFPMRSTTPSPTLA
jgi:hypothetical protein